MHSTHVLRSLVIGALALTGCNKDGEDSGTAATKTSNDTSTASESNSEGGNTTTGAPTTTTDPTNVSGTGETGTPETSGAETGSSGCGFLCGSTGEMPNANECDIWKQDCPPTEKCMPWDNSGGNSWKTFRVPAIHCCLSDSK